MPGILVVEDDLNTNEAMCEFLKDKGYRVFSALDGEKALKLFEIEKPELVVLDLMIPKITGMGVLHKIRETSDVPVLILTAIADEYTQVLSFDEKADDYITKPFSLIVLSKHIEALLRRTGFGTSDNRDNDDKKIKVGSAYIDFKGYSARNADGAVDVTPKEMQLLKYLIDNKGVVVSREQILDAVWGMDAFVEERTIDTYIMNLRKKLETESIITVKGIGYKYED